MSKLIALAIFFTGTLAASLSAAFAEALPAPQQMSPIELLSVLNCTEFNRCEALENWYFDDLCAAAAIATGEADECWALNTAINAHAMGKAGHALTPDAQTDAVGSANDLSDADQQYAIIGSGMPAIAVMDYECGHDITFIRGWWVETVDLSESVASVLLREHLAAVINVDLLRQEAAVAYKSSSYGDYWCVPKRAVCYATLAADKFGSTQSAGDEVEVARADIYGIARGMPEAFLQAGEGYCPRERVAASAE